jgi:Sigma-70, region 4
MSRSDQLPPDQRAALSLLLRQGKSHAEVAGMLNIPTEAVHDRAHAALIVLAPREARELSTAKRKQIGEYLLRQESSVAEQMQVRNELAAPGPAREWALAVVRELEPIADGRLADIPPLSSTAPTPQPAAVPAPAPAPAPAAVPVAAAGGAAGPPWEPAGRGLPSSRLGGGLLLAILLAAVVVTIILVSNGSGGGSKAKSTATTGSTASTGAGAFKKEGHFALKPPDSSSTSTGYVEIVSEGEKRALFVNAEHVPATKGFFYAVWLYNSRDSAEPVSRSPEVGKSHSFSGAVALPSNAGEFKEVLITRETSSKPSRPGHVVLRGSFSVPAQSG